MPRAPVQDCRDDHYAACQRIHRETHVDRGYASTTAAVRSETGCLATARTNLRGHTTTDFHGPCSTAEQALITQHVQQDVPDPRIRSAASQAKDLATKARHAKKAAGLAGLTAGTLLGEPTLAQKSTELLL